MELDTTSSVPAINTTQSTEIIPISRREKALEKVGATREKAYKAMVDGLSATTVALDKFGDEHEMPDNNARLKAAELISKLHGDMKEQSSGPTVVGSVHINISAEKMAEFTAMLAGVKEELGGLLKSGRQTGEVVDAEYQEA